MLGSLCHVQTYFRCLSRHGNKLTCNPTFKNRYHPVGNTHQFVQIRTNQEYGTALISLFYYQGMDIFDRTYVDASRWLAYYKDLALFK